MDIQQLSGLEILEKFKDDIFPDPTMMVAIPMKIMAVDKGCIEFQAVARNRHLSSIQIIRNLLFFSCVLCVNVSKPLNI